MANRYARHKHKMQRREARATDAVEAEYYEVSRKGATECPVIRFPCPDDLDLEVRMHRWFKEGQLVDFMLEVYDTRTDKKLTSVDCKHGTIHRHNETRRERPRKTLFPLTDQDELAARLNDAVDEVVKYAKDVKAQRSRK